MSSAKNFILCVHAHQPVGNLKPVFEEAYEKAYRPFWETLERHPGVRLSAHFSGSLIDWIEKNRPEFFSLIEKLHARGQVELLGGAYYEPIFGVISERDLAGQLEMMRQKMHALFGARPEGAWLTERVWDPHLVGPLRRAGIAYTILDDFHMERAGAPAPYFGYYQTGNGNGKVDVFSSIRLLRYLIPFRDPHEAFDFITKAPADSSEAVIFADDLEKFGLWPGTFRRVYTEKWLERFLSALEEGQKVKTWTLGEFRRQHAGRGHVDIPHASYHEMMEWSGGSFYEFFKKYPESGYMFERMRALSEAVSRLDWNNGHSAGFADVTRSLYKAQCNCSYWHGVFGGLYLHHLRSAVFENLLRAERAMLADRGIHDGRVTRLSLASGDRWRVESKRFLYVFNPAYGGALEELDDLSKSANLMCNLGRRREPYHAILNGARKNGQNGASMLYKLLGAKEKGLAERLVYDSARRLSFMDHLFRRPLSLEGFLKNRYRERGNFIGEPYAARFENGAQKCSLILEKKGELRRFFGRRALRLAKKISLGEAGVLKVRYSLANESPLVIKGTFGVEFNFSIFDESIQKGIDEEGVARRIFRDAWSGASIELGFSVSSAVLAGPIETVSESEAGMGPTYQGLAVLSQVDFAMEAGQAFEHEISLKVF